MAEKILNGKDAVLLFLILLLAGALLLIPSIHGHDGILNYVYLRSIVFDGDLDFKNDYLHFDEATSSAYELARKPAHEDTGLQMNYYGVGSALLWSPFYLAGHGIRYSFFEDPAQTAYDFYPGDDRASRWFISLASLFWATLGLMLLYILGRRLWSAKSALLALGVVLLASPLPFYIYFHPSMSHANSFFAVSLLIFLLYNQDPPYSQIQWMAIGACGALIMMTRFQDAVLLLIPMISELIRLISYRRQMLDKSDWNKILAGYATAIVALLLAFLPQNLAWKELHASFFSGPAHYLSIDSLHLTRPVYFFKLLFSSNHGLLFWHPLLIAGLIGLFLKFKVNGIYRSALITPLILHIYIIACWDYWWAGASFGHRMFISVLPLLYLGVLNLLDHLADRKHSAAIFGVILALFAVWNGGLIVQYGAEMIPREGKVQITSIMRNQFVEVPKFVWTKGARLVLKKEPNL